MQVVATFMEVQRLSDQGRIPKREHPEDAGLDLRAAEYTVIPSESYKIVNCDIAVAIPKGSVGLVCPRSGLAARNGVTVLNAPGIIDSNYRGPLMVVLQNTGKDAFRIKPGDRIAQLLIMPLTPVVVADSDVLSETDRGSNGFGSTGV